MSDQKLAEALADLQEETFLKLLKDEVGAGKKPLDLLHAAQQGMAIVGKRFQAGEYYVSELIMAGEIMKQGMVILAPKGPLAAGPSKGKVVVGTVKGDIHDIGKNLVVTLLRANGYEVEDLGVDVAPDRVVAAVKASGAKVVGLSALLTTSLDSMRSAVAALDAAGLRSATKVMIGGGLMSVEVGRYVGADAWGTDAQVAVTLCDQWLRRA